MAHHRIVYGVSRSDTRWGVVAIQPPIDETDVHHWIASLLRSRQDCDLEYRWSHTIDVVNDTTELALRAHKTMPQAELRAYAVSINGALMRNGHTVELHIEPIQVANEGTLIEQYDKQYATAI